MISATKRAIDRAMARVQASIRSTVQRVVLSAIKDDTNGIQLVTVKGMGDQVHEAEHMQPAGLTSRPTSGEGVAVAVGGNPDNLIVLGLANFDNRPSDLAAGDTTVFDEHDNRVDLSATGIELHQGGTTSYAVKADKLKTFLDNLNTAWVVVPNDGGAALKTALTTALATLWTPVPATKVKVE